MPYQIFCLWIFFISEFRLVRDLYRVKNIQFSNVDYSGLISNRNINIKNYINGERPETCLARWDSYRTGRKGHIFFPKVFDRVKLKNLNIHFYNLQMLSGHGQFGSYLHRFRLADDYACTLCPFGAEDNIDRSVFYSREENNCVFLKTNLILRMKNIERIFFKYLFKIMVNNRVTHILYGTYTNSRVRMFSNTNY